MPDWFASHAPTSPPPAVAPTPKWWDLSQLAKLPGAMWEDKGKIWDAATSSFAPKVDAAFHRTGDSIINFLDQHPNAPIINEPMIAGGLRGAVKGIEDTSRSLLTPLGAGMAVAGPATKAVEAVAGPVIGVGEDAIGTVGKWLKREPTAPPVEPPFSTSRGMAESTTGQAPTPVTPPIGYSMPSTSAARVATPETTVAETQARARVPVARASDPPGFDVESLRDTASRQGTRRLLDSVGGSSDALPPIERARVQAGVPAEMPAPPPTAEDTVGQLLDTAGSAAPPVPPVPPAPARVDPLIERLHAMLTPAWEDTVASQAGDQIPFTVDPRESLPAFNERVTTEDPRQLMGGKGWRERDIRQGLDAGRTPNQDMDFRASDPGGEAGFVDPSALAAGIRPLAEGANKLQYFSMLSSPLTQAKNVLGNIGAVGAHAAETALSGRPRDAARVLSEFFRPQTFGDVGREYVASGTAPLPGDRWGDMSGPLGVPGRILHSVDAATKDALARAGISPDLAEEITFTNRPKSQSGASTVDYLNRTPLAKLAVPFSKTAINIAERGLERTPGIGYLAQALSKGALKTSLPKQILGAAAMGAGAYAGGGSGSHPYLDATMAPYSLPFAMGNKIAGVLSKPEWTGGDVVGAGLGTTLDAAPLPDKGTLARPGQWMGRFSPNLLRDISTYGTGVDPNALDTSRWPVTGKALAKIPFLNSALFPPKRGKAGSGAVPVSSGGDWFATHAPGASR